MLLAALLPESVSGADVTAHVALQLQGGGAAGRSAAAPGVGSAGVGGAGAGAGSPERRAGGKRRLDAREEPDQGRDPADDGGAQPAARQQPEAAARKRRKPQGAVPGAPVAERALLPARPARPATVLPAAAAGGAGASLHVLRGDGAQLHEPPPGGAPERVGVAGAATAAAAGYAHFLLDQRAGAHSADDMPPAPAGARPGGMLSVLSERAAPDAGVAAEAAMVQVTPPSGRAPAALSSAAQEAGNSQGAAGGKGSPPLGGSSGAVAAKATGGGAAHPAGLWEALCGRAADGGGVSRRVNAGGGGWPGGIRQLLGPVTQLRQEGAEAVRAVHPPAAGSHVTGSLGAPPAMVSPSATAAARVAGGAPSLAARRAGGGLAGALGLFSAAVDSSGAPADLLVKLLDWGPPDRKSVEGSQLALQVHAPSAAVPPHPPAAHAPQAAAAASLASAPVGSGARLRVHSLLPAAIGGQRRGANGILTSALAGLPPPPWPPGGTGGGRSAKPALANAADLQRFAFGTAAAVPGGAPAARGPKAADPLAAHWGTGSGNGSTGAMNRNAAMLRAPSTAPRPSGGAQPRAALTRGAYASLLTAPRLAPAPARAGRDWSEFTQPGDSSGTAEGASHPGGVPATRGPRPELLPHAKPQLLPAGRGGVAVAAAPARGAADAGGLTGSAGGFAGGCLSISSGGSLAQLLRGPGPLAAPAARGLLSGWGQSTVAPAGLGAVADGAAVAIDAPPPAKPSAEVGLEVAAPAEPWQAAGGCAAPGAQGTGGHARAGDVAGADGGGGGGDAFAMGDSVFSFLL